MTIVHLAPELVLEIILRCPPDTLANLQRTSSWFNDLITEHEEYLCKALETAYCAPHSSELYKDITRRWSFHPSIRPLERLQILWQREQIIELILQKINLDFMGSLADMAEDEKDTESPKYVLRAGLCLLWAYEDRTVGVSEKHRAAAKEEFVNSLDVEELDMFYGAMGICAELLLKAAYPDVDDLEDWNEGDRLMMGMEPVSYTTMELVLTKGLSFVGKALGDEEQESSGAIKEVRDCWGRYAITPVTNESVQMIIKVRGRKGYIDEM